jgi:hypothetical protein
MHDNIRITRCSAIHKFNLTRYLYALQYVNTHLHKFAPSVWTIIAVESGTLLLRILEVRVQPRPGDQLSWLQFVVIFFTLSKHTRNDTTASFHTISNYLLSNHPTTERYIDCATGRVANLHKPNNFCRCSGVYFCFCLIKQPCNIQPGSGVRPASYQCVPMFLAGGKTAGVWRWPLTSI